MPACISGCSGVIICKVATGGVLRVKKFAQHGPIVGVSVKKFALRARNTPNLTFLRLLGEFCRGLSGGGAVPGEFCRVCRPATVPGTVPGPTLPRPCHRPRNSSWPDTTPALPLPTGTAAWPVGTAISHAIPQQLVQTLNLHRWNCNVFWVC